MRITDLLRAEGIKLHANPSGKASAIDMLVDLQYAAGHIHDKAKYMMGLSINSERLADVWRYWRSRGWSASWRSWSITTR